MATWFWSIQHRQPYGNFCLVYTAQIAVWQLLFCLYSTNSCMATYVWSIQHRQLYAKFCSLDRYFCILYQIFHHHYTHYIFWYHKMPDTIDVNCFEEIYNLFVEIYTLPLNCEHILPCNNRIPLYVRWDTYFHKSFLTLCKPQLCNYLLYFSHKQHDGGYCVAETCSCHL